MDSIVFFDRWPRIYIAFSFIQHTFHIWHYNERKRLGIHVEMITWNTHVYIHICTLTHHFIAKYVFMMMWRTPFFLFFLSAAAAALSFAIKKNWKRQSDHCSQRAQKQWKKNKKIKKGRERERKSQWVETLRT